MLKIVDCQTTFEIICLMILVILLYFTSFLFRFNTKKSRYFVLHLIPRKEFCFIETNELFPNFRGSKIKASY